FAPPFYGRPPTPLPPSPSLTSLLRPNFSTHNTSTLASTDFRSPKQPIPRASPKVPTYEYYGFTLYLTSSLAFIVYLLWSFLPSPFLHQLGIYYYPNRWWALAIPAWMVMLVLYIYVALAAYNVGYLTIPLHRVECLVDEAANVAVVDEGGKVIRTNERASWRGVKRRQSSTGKAQLQLQSKSHPPPELDWRTLWTEGTDAVMDIPIGGVCEILYGKYDDDDRDDND
ncbi:PIG-P-domain-containing protein, partial [Sphaerulina musiva SO2202]